MITIGCTIFLSAQNAAAIAGAPVWWYTVCGAVAFCVGLYLVCGFGMNLFTGKIGYFLHPGSKMFYLHVWLGNLCGALIAALLVRIARADLTPVASNLIDTKNARSLLVLFAQAIMCGVLMYGAVDNYSRNRNMVGVCGLVFCVCAFILCGFEHSIANMGYVLIGLSSADQILPSLVMLLVVSLGNSVGAIAFDSLMQSKKQ